jgi:putative Holliday junction resolvase
LSKTAVTYFGFDFGERRIGIAVGQSLTGTATPLAIVNCTEGTPPWSDLAKLFDEWQPDIVIVGLPLNMDGTEQRMTVRARRFGHQLHARFERPIYFADERLSTWEARDRPQTRRRGGHDPHDAVAAQVILEDWMASDVGTPDLN